MSVSKQTIETVYNRFKFLRQAAGWTSEQVAAELGLSRQTIVNIETKKMPLSRIQCIAFLAILNERGFELPELQKIVRAVLAG